MPYAPLGTVTHTVVPGDTLYGIARRFGTQVKTLVDFNYLVPPYIIYPGQQLVVAASLR